MTAAREHSEVQFGRTRISYAIRRSSRRRTVAVTVAPPGLVLLTAPAATPVERLDRVVHEKARWIVSRLRLVRPVEQEPLPREFVSGETYLYLGRQYRLLVRTGGPSISLDHGRFLVRAPVVSGHRRADAVQKLLERWYRDHARRRLQEQVEWWSRRVGVAVPKLIVRDQERRWASCSSGGMRFNWRIIQAPMKLVEYVVAHETVHLLHDDHGRRFWSKLGEVLPDYEVRREALRQMGPRLQW
jgi:predicted metal-dependent hydrolase